MTEQGRLDCRLRLSPVQDAEDAFALGDLLRQLQQLFAVHAEDDSQGEQYGAADRLVLVWAGTSFSQPTLVPLLVQLGFSLALLPVTLMSLCYGLWMLAGYNEIEVTPRFLTATCRLWGFGWPRRRNVAGVRGLCLVSFRSKSGIGSRFLCELVGSWDSRSAGR